MLTCTTERLVVMISSTLCFDYAFCRCSVFDGKINLAYKVEDDKLFSVI